eukprot:scaffold92877_cov18-Tisochrysis_lutea.AAC.1
MSLLFVGLGEAARPRCLAKPCCTSFKVKDGVGLGIFTEMRNERESHRHLLYREMAGVHTSKESRGL